MHLGPVEEVADTAHGLHEGRFIDHHATTLYHHDQRDQVSPAVSPGDHESVPRDHELPNERVYRVIKERIGSGEYQPGSQLPTVGELAGSFAVSRATIVKAMKQLQDDGYVVSRARWASFVADSPPGAPGAT